jgi:hypothetical protein
MGGMVKLRGLRLCRRYELRLESRLDALARIELREIQFDGNEVRRRVVWCPCSFHPDGLATLRQEITKRAQKVLAALTVRLAPAFRRCHSSLTGAMAGAQ